MEGLCDANIAGGNFPTCKYNSKVIMYAGGLEEKYGIKMLVDAFKLIDKSEVELHLYGSGSYVVTLEEEIKKDPRIKYFGVCSNQEIVLVERKSAILVNPRFTNEDFVRYSFPSKNMEYMASGTPLLCTKLPGMPKEYYPYVYLIENETLDGYVSALKDVLGRPECELKSMGDSAREFVLKEKNNIVQARRISDFLKSN
jgi:glycosyltransferase involved in cell wall biosynthesis